MFETLILNYCIIIRLHGTDCQVSAAHVVMFNGPSALHLRHVTFLHRSAEPQGFRRRSHGEKSFRFSGPIFFCSLFFLHTEIAGFFLVKGKKLCLFFGRKVILHKTKKFFQVKGISEEKPSSEKIRSQEFFWYYAMTKLVHMIFCCSVGHRLRGVS